MWVDPQPGHMSPIRGRCGEMSPFGLRDLRENQDVCGDIKMLERLNDRRSGLRPALPDIELGKCGRSIQCEMNRCSWVAWACFFGHGLTRIKKIAFPGPHGRRGNAVCNAPALPDVEA